MDEDTWEKVRRDRYGNRSSYSSDCPGRGEAKFVLTLRTVDGRPSIQQLEDIEEVVYREVVNSKPMWRVGASTSEGIPEYYIAWILSKEHFFVPHDFKRVEGMLTSETHLTEATLTLKPACVGERDFERNEMVGQTADLSSLSDLPEKIEEEKGF